MTRVLGELLGAEQPRFNHVVQQLEQAAGAPSTDIRLTTEIAGRLKQKIRELGLDPADTTNNELYRALEERFGRDEAAIREALGVTTDVSVQEVLLAVQRFSMSTVGNKESFVLKAIVAKRLLKKVPPKKAMKLLGYRSFASMLKHEQASLIYAASFAVESKAWQKKFLSQYEELQPRDFEMRSIEIVLPQHGRWTKLSDQVTLERKQNIMAFSELGVVIILPLTKDISGLAITNLILVLQAVNEIVSVGTYLKLHQMTPKFGEAVRVAANGEPHVKSSFIEKNVPWKVLHQYYARFQDAYNPLIFEPHVSPSDLKWYSPERTLEELHHGMRFWRDTPYTAQLKEGGIVSLSLLDVAINYCNSLAFVDRITEFSREHLWQEFMIRYLNLDNIEQTLSRELQPEYALNDELA